MKPLNIGVIGCGYWGPKLIRNFHELPGARLAWICDLRAERLTEMEALYPGVRTTRDYQELLQADIDAVVIATPVSTHYPLALEAMRRGRHVLVEKPLAATVRQAEEIAGEADRMGLVAMVGHTFQYNPAVEAVRQVVAGGELGELFYVNSTRANLGLLQPDINVIWDLAPHDVSILLHVLDDRPVRVFAQGAVFIQRERRIHELAYVTIMFESGIMATLRLSWLDPVKTRSLSIVGSRRMLLYDDIAQSVTVYDKGVEVPPYSNTLEEFNMSYRHGPERAVTFEWTEPLRLQCAAFLDWINGGPPAPSSARFAVAVVRVLEAAQRSLQNDGRGEEIAL